MAKQSLQKKSMVLDPLDRNAVKRRFLAINRERLRRVQMTLRDRNEDFLDLLPLLFHINHPMLPGYLTAETPAGIADYAPTDASIEAGARMFKSFDHRRRAQHQYDILGLYLMGSSGTIAHSSKSDFDIWVCHRPDLDEKQVAALRHKAEGVSSWADSLGLEVHFFIMNVDRFRDGETDELSEESSGSSQHALLVEEFYRTGLLVAGRFPVWWLVPPEHEANYSEYVAELLRKRFVNPNDCLDFGGVEHLSAGEFFGAAIWQLYKAVESPYKSVLKILLAEAYADEFPNVELLSLAYKKAVYDGETRLDHLDPYVLMHNKVEQYLERHEDYGRLEIARRCLYFKVNERMSRADTLRNSTWRREAMRDLVDAWGWERAQLYNLDARRTWKIDRVMEERRSLINVLNTSYQALSRFARGNADSLSIDPGELNKLGRKLYTAFERKSGKVEIINPGISTDLMEARLSIHRKQRDDHDNGWLLYRDAVTESDAPKHTPIKQANSFIEILAWCHFNHLLNPSLTMISLFPQRDSMEQWELRSVVDCMDQLFPGGDVPENEMEDLAQPARIMTGGIFVNLGHDPLSKLTRQGKQLITDRNDALRFGGRWENLATTFDVILVTSWQEIRTFSYRSETALLDCLCDYLAWSPLGSGQEPAALPCFSFSSTRGGAIARRIEEVFQSVVDCFYHHAEGPFARYVVHAGTSYYVLEAENNVPRHTKLDSLTALLAHLGASQVRFSPVVLDPHTLADHPLAQVFKTNREGAVQLFFQVDREFANVYVVDEKGSLFYQRTPFRDKLTLLSQYRRFLESVLHRRDETGTASVSLNDIEYYQLVPKGQGKFRLVAQDLSADDGPRGYLGIQVLGDIREDNRKMFTVYCGNREFSTLEYGDALFDEVALFVLAQRASGADYPIYITDIDLSRELLGAEDVAQLQTVHLLNYKKRIEAGLNQNLQNSA